VSLLTQGATAKDVVIHAGNSIRAVARDAITTEALMRGQDISAGYVVAASYSRTTELEFLEKKSEKWTVQN